ncbi:MAG: GNAT family N-acetyltransferase, partial [Kangiellaceae bacterium]
MMNKIELTHRIATKNDIDDLIHLMKLSIEENMKAFLSKSEIEAAKETMGVDKTLLEDGTYFIIETVHDGKTIIVGCGGWGKR